MFDKSKKKYTHDTQKQTTRYCLLVAVVAIMRMGIDVLKKSKNNKRISNKCYKKWHKQNYANQSFQHTKKIEKNKNSTRASKKTQIINYMMMHTKQGIQ